MINADKAKANVIIKNNREKDIKELLNNIITAASKRGINEIEFTRVPNDYDGKETDILIEDHFNSAISILEELGYKVRTLYTPMRSYMVVNW